jgi:FKBP-type peptidyl-prolyl cis-trans isomerase
MIKKFAPIFLVALLCACKGGEADTAAASDALGKDDSYAFGIAFGSEFKQTGLHFDYDAFARGFKDAVEGTKAEISFDEAMAKAQEILGGAMSRRSEEYRQEEMLFLAENSKKAGIIVTGSGLQYEVISEGGGRKPLETDKVQVHYKGTLVDGTEFDSSYARGEPADFFLDQVIPGWTEGIQLMSVGSTYRFYIPSNLAYGEGGTRGVIHPYAALIFEVELLSVVE